MLLSPPSRYLCLDLCRCLCPVGSQARGRHCPHARDRFLHPAGGANAFLRREFQTISYFIVGLAILLFLAMPRESNVQIAVGFITGALLSMLTIVIGMNVATRANARTTQAARTLPGKALTIAFRGGAAMGLTEARPSLSLSCSPSYGVLPAVRRLPHAECVLHRFKQPLPAASLSIYHDLVVFDRLSVLY